ncbi:hypothetical protein PINS_up014123 [Pythium insidiosum]|nr:hypothetical protein PINS_up014123 [Pythium insidiosum]
MEGEVDHAGWAHKQGSKVRTWKKRFFVLRGRDLRYYASPGPTGQGVDEKGRVLVLAVDASQGDTLLLECEHKPLPLKLKPLNADDTREWVRKLQAALADYDDPYEDDDLAEEHDDKRGGNDSYLEKYFSHPDSVNSGLLASAPSLVIDLDDNQVEDHSSDCEDDELNNNRQSEDLVVPIHRTPGASPVAKPSASVTVAHEGWLSVGDPADTRAIWKKRYGVVSSDRKFAYYATKGSASVLETVDVTGIALSSTRINTLELQVKNNTSSARLLGIAADSRAELIEWDRAFAQLLHSRPLVFDASSRRGFWDNINDDDNDELDNNQAEHDARLSRRLSSYRGGMTCEGWLLVHYQGATDWSRRYVVLNGAQLQQRAEPGGKVIDESYVLDMKVLTTKSATEMEIELMSGDFVLLRAENTHDAETWMHALGELTDDKLPVRVPVKHPAPNRRNQMVPDAPTSPPLYAATPPARPASGSPSSQLRKSGWLMKEGYHVRSWKKRYFVLEDDTLQYFEKVSGDPKGSGVVFRVVRASSPAFAMDVHFMNGRILRIAASNKVEQDDWFSALSNAAALCALRATKVDDSQGTSTVSNRKRGWLLKKGQRVKSWKRRYFVLERATLAYSDTPGSEVLGSGIVFDVVEGDLRPFCLNVRFQNGRLLHVVASDETDFSEWLEALQLASNITESFVSQQSDNKHELDRRLELDMNDDGFSLPDSPEEEEDLGTGGLALWTAAMNGQPEWDRQSSSASEASDRTGASSQIDRDRATSTASSVSSHSRTCSGWLRKQSKDGKRWSRRYFTLHATKLSSFRSESGALLHSYVVEGVDELKSEVPLCLALQMACGRRLVIAAESAEDYDRWHAGLSGVIADARQSKGGSAQSPVSNTVKTSSPAGVSRSRSGWLESEGQHFRTWRKRYFTYKNGALIFYNDIGGAAQGNGIVIKAEYDASKPHTLRVSLDNSRILRVSADSQNEIDEWFSVLNKTPVPSAAKPAASAPTGPKPEPRRTDRQDRLAAAQAAAGANSRHDPNDYLANDSISNESFLRLHADTEGSDLALTNGSFQKERLYKGDLPFTPALVTPDEATDVHSDSDDDLSYIRNLNADDDAEEIKRRSHAAAAPRGDALGGQCAACCVVM